MGRPLGSAVDSVQAYTMCWRLQFTDCPLVLVHDTMDLQRLRLCWNKASRQHTPPEFDSVIILVKIKAQPPSIFIKKLAELRLTFKLKSEYSANRRQAQPSVAWRGSTLTAEASLKTEAYLSEQGS